MPERRLRFGAFVAGRRKQLGMNRKDLAMRTTWSEAVITKIEQATRPPTVDTLIALFDALAIPTMYREQLFNLLYPGIIQEMYGALPATPTPSDLADLASYPYPAAFMLLPETDVVATSPLWPVALPGMVAGRNLMEWIFTDPYAEKVLVDWETYAHAYAAGMNLTGRALFAPGRYDQIQAVCSAHPEWGRLSTKPVSGTAGLNENLRIRSPLGGHDVEYLIKIDRPEFPRRAWFTYRFVPKAARVGVPLVPAP